MKEYNKPRQSSAWALWRWPPRHA